MAAERNNTWKAVVERQADNPRKVRIEIIPRKTGVAVDAFYSVSDEVVTRHFFMEYGRCRKWLMRGSHELEIFPKPFSRQTAEVLTLWICTAIYDIPVPGWKELPDHAITALTGDDKGAT